MANLNEAFNLQKNPKNKIVNDQLNKSVKNNKREQYYYKNNINMKFTKFDDAFDRIKISNPKYDNISRYDTKPIFGYICKICNGPVGYHISIQENLPHDFIKDEYRELLPFETGPFINGKALIN